ncbi:MULTISPECIES: ModD protein [unclassified Simplicispira]|uniref:ModD protein n=1 Tax=unclassified Simplicispira TaxID=2630407 RepID=UPI000D5ED3F8|nr:MULTISPECIES: ModD protein [unclassified Simplicispira]PVY55255.1 molybdenum transport protein [Simplicispira sp. 125]REG16198.1 molybdenum transport protein [Simplicispira sp. 110]
MTSLPSVFFDHATIDAWIAEDAPLLDLTTHLLAIGGQSARMTFTVRGDTVAACTEEAARVVQHCGGQVQSCVASGSRVRPGTALLVATGEAAGLLRAWKVAQNLLEYACGVAGATARMVQAVQAAAPGVAVLTTRKHAPGLRRIALKATLSGGAFPHRLGVGETVLVFAQHRALVGDWDAVRARLALAAPALAEKKCVVEVTSLEDACAAIGAGADVLQFDKVMPEQLRAWCPQLRERHPKLGLLAAGGVNGQNAADYAASGVDALVTSSLHYAHPADVGVQMEPQ